MSLQCSLRGNPKLPPCIFLHGFMGAKEDWDEIEDRLSRNHFCVAFDLPGHGLSPAIKEDYLMHLHNEIKHIVSAPPVLIGYSMGGRLAMQLAQSNPSAFSHLIVISANPGIADAQQREQRFAHDLLWIEKLHTLDMDAFLTEWYTQPIFQSLHKRPHLLESIVKKRSAQDARSMAEVMRILSIGRQSPVIHFHPRSLFLYGEEDIPFAQIYSKLPDSVSVHKIENSGHVILLENPKRCSDIILQWLEENP